MAKIRSSWKDRMKRGVSLTELAYLELEERIATLQLAPGEIISENQLAEALGIGRTPIREALQRLAREGLVIIMPRRGIVVSEINVQNQLEMLRLRREVERLVASLAASRATETERTEFKHIAEGMRRAASKSDDVAFMRLDWELNKLLAQSSRNEYAQRALSLTYGLSRRFWYMHYKKVLDLPFNARLHAELAEAIAAGKERDASDALDELIDYIEAFTRSSLDRPRSVQPKHVTAR